MLPVWLDYQRATLLWKCEWLDGAALARRGVPPSPLSLLGFVRHMAIVEWWWFDHVFTGSRRPSRSRLGTIRMPTSTTSTRVGAMADIELFRRQCDVSRAVVGGAESFDATSASAEKRHLLAVDRGPHD